MRKSINLIISCILLSGCDFMSTMDIVNTTDEIAIIEIDYDKLTWSEQYGNYYTLVDYNTDSFKLVNEEKLIYQFIIHPKGQFKLTSTLNVDPPQIDHIQTLKILTPYKKQYQGTEEIREAFQETKRWHYTLEIE